MATEINWTKALAVLLVGGGATIVAVYNGEVENAYLIYALILGYVFGNGKPLVNSVRSR